MSRGEHPEQTDLEKMRFRSHKELRMGAFQVQLVSDSKSLPTANSILGCRKNVLDVLAGKVGLATSEDVIGSRVHRTRDVAELEHDTSNGGQKPAAIGVLGLSIDVTDMKARAALEVNNARLVMEE